MIKKGILKYWFSLLPLVAIILSFVLSHYFVETPLVQVSRDTVLKKIIYVCGIIPVIWMFEHHKFLFKKGEYLRSLIICVGAAVVFLWAYKHKVTFRIEILLISLCALYSLIYRKWIKPDGVLISFFLLVILKYIGILWSVDQVFALEEVYGDRMYFLLLAPIVCLGFRVREDESMSFITLCFKMFLLLLTVNVCLYIFAYKSFGLPFFSFLTLNKGYMDYIRYILAWTFFIHPSFIAWVMLVVWGLAVWVWTKNKEVIPLLELIVYGILLYCVAFMLQARIVIVGFPIGVFLLGWFYISRKWSVRKHFLIEIGIFLLVSLAVYLLVTHTTYFSDPIREKMLAKAFDSIGKHPIVGNGTIYEKLVAQEAIGQIHIHNDFLATFLDLGVVGLFLLFCWVFFAYWKSLINKDYSIGFCLVMFLLLMNTDVLLNYIAGIYITVPFMIFIFFKQGSKGLLSS